MASDLIQFELINNAWQFLAAMLPCSCMANMFGAQGRCRQAAVAAASYRRIASWLAGRDLHQ